MRTTAASVVGRPLRDLLTLQCAAQPQPSDCVSVVHALAGACAQIAKLIRKGGEGAAHGAGVGATNSDGDAQRGLDVLTNDLVLAALRDTPTAYFASEEEDAILTLDPHGRLAVAVDPLDGSSNIDANISIGTIFSVYEVVAGEASASLFRPGREQVAAGYCIYGPRTVLMLSLGHGTHRLALDDDTGEFVVEATDIVIDPSSFEFAINASNYRHWHEPVRNFIDDCVAGSEGPRGRDFNMRWVASLVAETHRIFSRGGVFLYPGDRRKGYERGRLRLIYEAAPIAFLVEQAGGVATDGYQLILDKVPSALHERTPLIFGSSEKVARLQRYFEDPAFARDRSPLFRNRGLFSA